MKRKIAHKLLISTLLCTMCSTAYAVESYYSDYPSYAEDGNKLIFRAKLLGISSKSKGRNFPQVNNQSSDSNKRNLVADGVGAEAGAAIFLSKNVAAEFSLGIHAYRAKQSVINSVFVDYASAEGVNATKQPIYAFPASLILQYHVAPFGGVSPYAGVGYSMVYNHTSCKAISVKKLNSAPVFQIGVDIMFMDDTLLNFEVKKYILKTDVTYKKSFLGTDDMKTKLKLDPLVISVGLGFKV